MTDTMEPRDAKEQRDARFAAMSDNKKRVVLDAQLLASLCVPGRDIDRLISTMRDAQAGTPRGQSLDGDTRGGKVRLWCEYHERDVDDCRRAEMSCRGVPMANLTDPTGETGILPHDRAAADLKWARQALKEIDQRVRRLAKLQDVYLPADVGAQRSIADAPGTHDCTECYRYKQTQTPVSGRWKGKCTWCGEFLKEHGVEHVPMRLLEIRHRVGRSVNSRDVEQALAARKSS